MNLRISVLCVMLMILGCSQIHSQENKYSLVQAINDRDYKKIEEAIEVSKIEIDSPDLDGLTLLIYAVFNKDKYLINYLIEKGANPNYYVDGSIYHKEAPYPPFYSETVLDFAVRTRDKEFIKYLLSKGADINPKNEILSPLRKVSMHNDVEFLNFLKDQGAKVSPETGQNIVVASIITQNIELEADNQICLDVLLFWQANGVDISRDLLDLSCWDGIDVAYRREIRKTVRDFKRQKIKSCDGQMAQASEEINQEMGNRVNYLFLYYENNKTALSLLFAFSVVVIVWTLIKNLKASKKKKVSVSQTTNSVLLQEDESKSYDESELIKPLIVEQRGWEYDETIDIQINIQTIEDRINPIGLCNGHEKAVRQIIWYLRVLENYTDEDIKSVLGEDAVLIWYHSVLEKINVNFVRDVYKRSLFLLIDQYKKQYNAEETSLSENSTTLS